MKSDTFARGYRLKASTHRLIKKMQEELNLSQDKVISKAINAYYKFKTVQTLENKLIKENKVQK